MQVNLAAAHFAGFAQAPGVRVLVGDFNGDGRADLALVGGSGWTTIPVAFSNGDGAFAQANQPADGFASRPRDQ